MSYAAKPDPLSEFFGELWKLLEDWNKRTGCEWEGEFQRSFISEESRDGWAKQRAGPQARVTLTLTNAASPDRNEPSQFLSTCSRSLVMDTILTIATEPETEVTP